MSKLSVIIPTSGDSDLNPTIFSLLKSTYPPSEIIIISPKKIRVYKNEVIKIVYCKVKSQVKQRLIGFRKAKYQYILQSDDDIAYDKNCIENLVKVIKKQRFKSAVSPTILNQKRESIYSAQYKRPSWYNYLVNGSQGFTPGRFASSGEAFGFKTDCKTAKEVEVSWLPGGCVLHAKKNLSYKNYYPFKGKALGEDVIHSIIMKKKGVKLFISPAALCKTKLSTSGVSCHEIYLSLWKLNWVWNQVISTNTGSSFRKYLNIVFYLFYFLKQKMKC